MVAKDFLCFLSQMKQIKCSLCDYMCSNLNPDLKLHMKRQHQLDGDPGVCSQDTLTCTQCGFVVSNEMSHQCKYANQKLKNNSGHCQLLAFLLCGVARKCNNPEINEPLV